MHISLSGLMAKRGISNVVVTFLVILLSLSLVGVLSYVFRDSIESSFKSSSLSRYTLSFDIAPSSVFVNPNPKEVTFVLSRRAGAGEVEGFRIIITDSTGTTQTLSGYESSSLSELSSMSVRASYILSSPIVRLVVAPLIRSSSEGVVVGEFIADFSINAAGRVGSQSSRGQTFVCNDGIDNDNDGWIDFDGAGYSDRADPGCANPQGNSEANQGTFECGDGQDNADDEDTLIDGYDDGCDSYRDTDERNACNDGIDNDNDGKIDVEDAGCFDTLDNDESDDSSFQCSNQVDDDGDSFVDWPLDPGCSSAIDDHEGDSASRLPLRALMWSQTPSEFDYLVPFININISTISDYDLANLEGMYIGYRPSTIARKIKDSRDRYGVAVLYDWTFGSHSDGGPEGYGRQPISSYPQDRCQGTEVSCLWWDTGISEVSRRYQTYFTALDRELDRLGTPLDVMVLDVESFLSEYEIGRGDTYLSRWQALQNDPRLMSDTRYGGSVISQLGLPDANIISRIRDQPQDSGWWQKWDGVMYPRAARMISEAIAPVRSLMPTIQISAYDFYEQGDPSSDSYFVPNLWYPHTLPYGRQAAVGTHNAPSLYPYLNNPSAVYLTQAGTGSGANDVRPYPHTSFNVLRYSLNKARASLLGSSLPLHLWVYNYQYGVMTQRPLTDAYYDEWILHTSLLSPDFIFYWNPTPSASDADASRMQNILSEFNGVAGFSGKETLIAGGRETIQQSMIPWNAEFILTGISAGGRKIWRFTPDPTRITGINAESALVSESGLRVVLETTGKRLTFPDAVVYRPSNAVSSKGIWIVQSAGASPTIDSR